MQRIKTIAILLALQLFTSLGLAQPSHSLEGYVLNQEGSPLPGANIQIPDQLRGTSTDSLGFFSLGDLETGEIQLRITFLGYAPIDTLVTIPLPEELIIRMVPSETFLDQLVVQVTGLDTDLAQQVPLSTTYFPRTTLQDVPRFMGEPDVIRVIQNLPGVKTDSDFSGGMVVRGGRNDQNLILLDGMPVYNPWHMFGIFSALNSDAVSGVEFNKGVFPVRYGGRLSSVLNVEMEDGRSVDFLDQINIGLLSATISLGGKLSDKTSLYVTSRRTYMEPFLNLLDRRERETDLETGTLDQQTGYYFWDLNTKLSHQINHNKKVDLNLFYSRDRFRWDVEESLYREQSFGPNVTDTRESYGVSNTRIGWENMAASMRWSHEYNRLDYLVQGYLTYFKSQNSGSEEHFFEGSLRTVSGFPPRLTIRNRIETDNYQLDKRFNQEVLDIGLKLSGNLKFTERFSLSSGGEFVHHQFKRESALFELMELYKENSLNARPPTISETENRTDRFFEESIQPVEMAIYSNLNIEKGRFKIYPGIRFEHYVNSGASYTVALPRINAGIEISDLWSIYSGYGHFRQYFQTVGFDLVQFPVENWIWAGENNQPADAESWTIGTRYEIKNLGFLTVEGYYRNFKNLADLDPLESFKAIKSTGSMIPAYRDKILQGIGRAAGVEFVFDWGTERFSSQISYVFSRNRVKFDEINRGEWYPSRTDSPHDLGMNLRWKIDNKWVAGFVFGFKSGQPMTLALSGYDRENDPLNIGNFLRTSPIIMNERNNYRLPDYHRLDLFVTLRDRSFFGGLADITLSVINVYNRYNLFAINMTSDIKLNTGEDTIHVDPSYRFLSQLPILPMINFRFKPGGGQ